MIQNQKKIVRRAICLITPFRIVLLLSISYLLLMILYVVLASLGNGLNMDTYAANGTFQLYNPMRRLLHGQIIAKDFPFFHGVGVPLFHFPAFYILGHNIFAAEVVKWLVSPLAFLLSSLVIFWAYFRDIKKSIIATSILAIISLYCIDIIWPGNSLVGFRTTFPFVAGAFMLWRPSWSIKLKNGKQFQLYWPILYILFGLAIACGTEQGLAVALSYVVVKLITYIRSKKSIKKWLPYLLLEILYLSVVVYSVLSLLTLGHAHDALQYALVDIAKDQGWYFGAPPNSILNWNTLSQLFDTRMLYMIPILLGGLLSFIVGIKRKMLSKNELFVFSVLILYGFIVFFVSITGYWAPSTQLIPLERAAGIILVAILVKAVTANRKKLMTDHRALFVGQLCVLCLIIFVLCFHVFTTWQKISWMPIRFILTNTKLARHASDEDYISRSWQGRLASFKPYIKDGSTIWSTYTGLYDSTRGQLNGSTGGEDYIIHALGPDRRDRYTRDFIKQKPDYAITLKPSYFIFEEWLWSRHWPFYKELQTNYKIIAENDSHILWERQERNGHASTEKSSHTIPKVASDAYRVNLSESDRIRLYEITVTYKAKAAIPFSSKIPRYLMELSGSSLQKYPASLPQYETTWQFPVTLAPSDSFIELNPKIYGLMPGASIDISNITYKELSISKENLYMYYNNSCSPNNRQKSKTSPRDCDKSTNSLECYVSKLK